VPALSGPDHVGEPRAGFGIEPLLLGDGVERRPEVIAADRVALEAALLVRQRVATVPGIVGCCRARRKRG
jgi:hypothetical protein